MVIPEREIPANVPNPWATPVITAVFPREILVRLRTFGDRGGGQQNRCHQHHRRYGVGGKVFGSHRTQGQSHHHREYGGSYDRSHQLEIAIVIVTPLSHNKAECGIEQAKNKGTIIKTDHHQCRQMEKNIKKQRNRGNAQQVTEQNKMSRTGNGKKFGDSLHRSQ